MIVFLVLICFGSLYEFCEGCNVGYYGESCSKECPKVCHNKECNVISGKCLSCVEGYYNDIKEDCILCPENCTVCSSEKYCFACKSGFRGDVCDDVCTNCKPYTSCDKMTGYCFEKCSEGLSGELCNTPCNSKCKSCDRHNKDECILCADGYGVEKTCNQTDRVCNIRCKELVPSDRQSSFTSKTHIGLILGLVIGSVVTCSLCCSIVFIIVRRRRIKRSRSSERNSKSSKNDIENTELLSRAARTTETRKLQSAEKLTVLQIQGTFGAIEKKYGDMKINVDGNKVTVEVDPVHIENAFADINTEYDKIQQVQYAHSKSREWMNFSKEKQTVEYVQKKLQQEQLIGCWDINEAAVSVFVSDIGIGEKIKNTLLKSILEESVRFNKSSTNLLTSEWWGDFLVENQRKFRNKVHIMTKKHQEVIVIGTDDVVPQVKKLVNDFFHEKTYVVQCEPAVFEFVSKYWIQDDFEWIRQTGVNIKIKANGFELRGPSDKLIKGKQELNKKLNGIRSKQYILKKIGIVTVLETAKHSGKINDIEQEFRCVINLPQKVDERPSAMLCDYEVMNSEILDEKRKDSSADTYPLCYQTRRHKIKIQLIQGDIGLQKADIIVVGAASNLDLHSGSAFDTLLKKGGPRLRNNYKKHYPNGIHDGEIAVIDSKGLKCDKIYLTSLPPWKEAARCGKVLRNFMRKCLRLADKYDKRTIAFSSMVTGRHLGYPVDMAVSIMYGAVVEFDSSYSKTSLKDICIVVNKDDEKTIKAFEDHEHMRIYGASIVGSPSTDFFGGKFKIQIVSGDLSTQQTYSMSKLKMQGRENRKKRVLLEYGTNLIKPQTNSEYRMVKDGCAIGPIQLQVQVGDLLNNSADAIVIGVGANYEPKENVLDQDKVVMAGKGKLKAKCMIHVPFQNSLADWRNKLVDCLKEAGQKSKQSVAFPLLGSGARQNSFPADGIGECVFAAIDDFTSQNPQSSVTDVRLVVPDSNAGCIPAIIAGLQARTTDVNFQWGICKIFKSQLGFVADSKQFKESSVTIYSDAPINSDRCSQALVDRLGLEFSKKVVDADMDVIRCLEDEQISSIIDADIVVDSIFDKQTGKFTIFGPLRNVLAAVTCLHNKMRQYKSGENKYAKVLYDQTRWYWLCENQVASKEEEIPYDMLSNFIIETAYKKGNHTMELHYKDGKIYAINFEKLVEYRKTNTNDTVMLIRKDILKANYISFGINGSNSD